MKKLSILLSLLLISTLAFGQEAENRIYEISDFSKLLQSQVSPYLMLPNAGSQARNVRSNVIFGGLSKRSKMLEYGSVDSYAVKSLYRYYKSDATKYLIATGSTLMVVGDDDDGSFQTIRDQLSSGAKWQFITYMDMMIGVNGTDRPQKYDGESQITANTDGSRSAGILTTDLGSPFAELNTGSNLDASSWYQYKIAYYDGSTYYWSDSRTNPLLTGAAVRDITLTDIPIGPSGTTQRVIYRTVGDASRVDVEADTSFYRVATVGDNTTTTYNDAIADATILADSAPTWATAAGGTEVTPPIGKYIELHQERAWIANISGGKSDIYWSQAFLPDYFKQSVDYDQIRPDDGDEITSLDILLGLLVILKTNTIQKYQTDNTDSTLWAATDPFSFIGCPAPYTPQTTPLGIIYLARDGLYNFNGENSELISDVVRDKILDISQTDIEDTVGVYFNNEYQLSYTSDEGGAGQNDTVMVFDVVRNAYELDDKSIDSFAVFNSGSDFGTVYSGSSLSDGKVFIHDTFPYEWRHRYKSDLEAGTTDSIVIYGEENSPFMELGWGVTLDSTTVAGVTIDSVTIDTATIDRAGLTGTWWSDTVQLNAASFDEMTWNESLGGTGDVTFSLRSGVTEDAVALASWSSEVTDPTGSDISGITANTWAQIRASLSTTDITETPLVFNQDDFVIKVFYNKEGSTAETDITTIFERGWDNFGIPFYKKRIKKIEVHYEGTSGTLNFKLENSEGDIDTDFNIDLSLNPTADPEDAYFGNNTNKIFIWEPPMNSEDDPSPIGEFWRFTFSETGVVPWKTLRVKIKYDVEEFYED